MCNVQSENVVGNKPDIKNEKEAHALFHLWHKEEHCPYYWNAELVSPLYLYFYAIPISH